MALGSTSRVSVAYAPEASYAVSNPAAGRTKYRELRVTGESLDFAVTKTVSAEINATRSVSSQVATSASASGGVQGEMSHGEWDTLLAGTLQNSWTVSGTDGSLAIGATTTAFAAATITFSVATTHGLVVGQWFRMSKTGALNDGKLFRVHTSTAPTTTVITLDAGTPATVEGASATWFLQAARLSNGTTQSSFVVQRTMNDMSPVEYFAYYGMTPSKLSVKVASGALSTISFDFMGKSVLRSAASNLLVTGITAAGAIGAGTNTSVASFTGAIHAGTTATNCVIWANGSAITGTYVKSVGLDFDNSLRTQEAVCTLGAVGVGSGTINCTANIQLYFAEGAKFFTEFLANTTQELVFSSADSTGAAYVFTLPAASVATYKVAAGGKDSDLLVDVTFTALRDAVLNKVLVIDRCGPAVSLSLT